MMFSIPKPAPEIQVAVLKVKVFIPTKETAIKRGHYLTNRFLMHTCSLMNKITVFAIHREVVVIAATRSLNYFLYVLIL